MGFFGLLHCGEFLLPDADQLDAKRHLTIADVSLDTTLPQWRFQLHIKASKMDQFCQGAQVVLGATSQDLCPVAALLGRCLSIRMVVPYAVLCLSRKCWKLCQPRD